MIGFYLFLQRTQRIPKEACNASKNPEEFAKILIERLEKVKIQREQGEREAHNLAIHCEVWSNVTMLKLDFLSCVWYKFKDFANLRKSEWMKPKCLR